MTGAPQCGGRHGIDIVVDEEPHRAAEMWMSSASTTSIGMRKLMEIIGRSFFRIAASSRWTETSAQHGTRRSNSGSGSWIDGSQRNTASRRFGARWISQALATEKQGIGLRCGHVQTVQIAHTVTGNHPRGECQSATLRGAVALQKGAVAIGPARVGGA